MTYVDPFEIIDPRFRAYVIPIAWLETLHTGMHWSEGVGVVCRHELPHLVRHPQHPAAALERGLERRRRIPRRLELRQWQHPDRQGRLVSCEHRTRRVTRTEPDGSITVLAERYL